MPFGWIFALHLNVIVPIVIITMFFVQFSIHVFNGSLVVKLDKPTFASTKKYAFSPLFTWTSHYLQYCLEKCYFHNKYHTFWAYYLLKNFIVSLSLVLCIHWLVKKIGFDKDKIVLQLNNVEGGERPKVNMKLNSCNFKPTSQISIVRTFIIKLNKSFTLYMIKV
jgi:hypothetical protein